MKIFAERLKELRLEHNLTTTQLANALGIRDSSISRWENDVVSPSVEALYDVAKYFNVTADYLIGLED